MRKLTSFVLLGLSMALLSLQSGCVAEIKETPRVEVEVERPSPPRRVEVEVPDVDVKVRRE